MVSRVNFLETEPSRIDDVERVVREIVHPGIRDEPGFRGYIVLGDRETGEALGVTLWESDESREASNRKARQIRPRVEQETGGTMRAIRPAPYARSPTPHGRSPPATCTDAWGSRARTTSSHVSGAPSTACSSDSRPPCGATPIRGLRLPRASNAAHLRTHTARGRPRRPKRKRPNTASKSYPPSPWRRPPTRQRANRTA
jgi:quinol monooxygenase YgiN